MKLHLRLSVNPTHYTRGYFLTILCNCLYNVWNCMYADICKYSCISSAILESHSIFVRLVIYRKWK